MNTSSTYDWTSITRLNGEKIKMKTGICAVSFEEGAGYSIVYDCDKGDTQCHLGLGVKTKAETETTP